MHLSKAVENSARPMPILVEQREGCRLQVASQPGANATNLVGLHDGAVKIRLQAPPVDGRANEELCRFLAGIFSTPVRNIIIQRGLASRRKQVLLGGVSVATAMAIFGQLGIIIPEGTVPA